MAVGLLKRLLSINRLVWIFYLVCVSWFVYLTVFYLQGWHQFQDDLNVAVPFVSTVVLGGTSVVLKCNAYVLLCVFCKVRCEVRKSGWLRCVLFVFFACFFSYIFVTVALDKSLIFGWNLSKKHLVGLMEKNIYAISDQLYTQNKFIKHTRITGFHEPDIFSRVAELTLIAISHTSLSRLPDRKIRRALPPGAIVSVKASYWQNEQDENEIAVDYLINQRSLRSSASVWLCSKLLLLYFWMSKSESCLRSVDFCIPPLEVSLAYNANTGKAKSGSFIFCLGPETYGWLEVEFYRQYYNSSTKQYELVRVIFPVKTFIQPGKQNLISDLLLYNDSSTYAYKSWYASDWIPTNLELQMTRQLAQAEALYFHREELIFIGALAVVCIAILIGLLHVIDKAGTLCKKLILKRPVPPNHTRDRNNEDNDGDPEREVSRPQYDIFLSLSETDAGRTGTCIVNIAEALKQRVFFPVRDIPPNLPELSVVDAAIENSRRFVILFSRHYMQENRLFEAEAIVNSVRLRCQNFPQTILVVKLDYSELPGWLTPCSVADWTFFGPMEHHLLNLQTWIISFGYVELLFLTLVRSLVR